MRMGRNFLAAAVVAAIAMLGASFASAQDKQFEDNINKYLASDKGQDALIDAIQKAAARKQQQAMQNQSAADVAGVNAKNRMDVANVGRSIVYMASLPLDANVMFHTVMATQMPFAGRG